MLICMERKKEDDAGLQSRKKELPLIGENPGFIPVNFEALERGTCVRRLGIREEFHILELPQGAPLCIGGDKSEHAWAAGVPQGYSAPICLCQTLSGSGLPFPSPPVG